MNSTTDFKPNGNPNQMRLVQMPTASKGDDRDLAFFAPAWRPVLCGHVLHETCGEQIPLPSRGLAIRAPREGEL